MHRWRLHASLFMECAVTPCVVEKPWGRLSCSSARALRALINPANTTLVGTALPYFPRGGPVRPPPPPGLGTSSMGWGGFDAGEKMLYPTQARSRQSACHPNPIRDLCDHHPSQPHRMITSFGMSFFFLTITTPSSHDYELLNALTLARINGDLYCRWSMGSSIGLGALHCARHSSSCHHNQVTHPEPISFFLVPAHLLDLTQPMYPFCHE